MEPGVKPGLKLDFRTPALQPRAPLWAVSPGTAPLECLNSSDSQELTCACGAERPFPKCEDQGWGKGQLEARETTGSGLEFNTVPSWQNQCVAESFKKFFLCSVSLET